MEDLLWIKAQSNPAPEVLYSCGVLLRLLVDDSFISSGTNLQYQAAAKPPHVWNRVTLVQVEVWLNRVLDSMRDTVRHEMTEAVAAYEEKPREQWLFDYPAQVLNQHL